MMLLCCLTDGQPRQRTSAAAGGSLRGMGAAAFLHTLLSSRQEVCMASAQSSPRLMTHDRTTFHAFALLPSIHFHYYCVPPTRFGAPPRLQRAAATTPGAALSSHIRHRRLAWFLLRRDICRCCQLRRGANLRRPVVVARARCCCWLHLVAGVAAMRACRGLFRCNRLLPGHHRPAGHLAFLLRAAVVRSRAGAARPKRDSITTVGSSSSPPPSWGARHGQNHASAQSPLLPPPL